MTRIGLLSDTHGFLDDMVFKHFENCDEIWHAGDFGDLDLASRLAAFKPLKGVYGNIDDLAIRTHYPEKLQWYCEDVNIFMVHIGQPYWKSLQTEIQNRKEKTWELRPQLFICGHSHILKVMYEEKLACLHMNPGAAGKQGWHTVRTLIRFIIDGKDMKNCEVIELGKR